MSPRERTLALLVGGVIALLVNVVIIKFFMGKKTEFQLSIAKTEGQIAQKKALESERAFWAERDAWLNANLPTFGDPLVANRELTKQLTELAKKHGVTLETPQNGVPSRQKEYVGLGVRVSGKGPWVPMMEFLRELQEPGQFIVFDPLDLKVDATEKTLLRADVTVTKWFAPSAP